MTYQQTRNRKDLIKTLIFPIFNQDRGHSKISGRTMAIENVVQPVFDAVPSQLIKFSDLSVIIYDENEGFYTFGVSNNSQASEVKLSVLNKNLPPKHSCPLKC